MKKNFFLPLLAFGIFLLQTNLFAMEIRRGENYEAEYNEDGKLVYLTTENRDGSKILASKIESNKLSTVTIEKGSRRSFTSTCFIFFIDGTEIGYSQEEINWETQKELLNKAWQYTVTKDPAGPSAETETASELSFTRGIQQFLKEAQRLNTLLRHLPKATDEHRPRGISIYFPIRPPSLIPGRHQQEALTLLKSLFEVSKSKKL